MEKIVMILLCFVCFSCDKSEQKEVADTEDPPLVGHDGNPRFNLVYTNQGNVDMDLFVKTPSGAVIYYDNTSADSGTLDVDCWCDECVKGPTENVYWENGAAPSGTYEYWVKYYANCGTPGATSNYTVKVIRNGTVLETKTGNLSAVGESEHWTFVQ